MKKLYLASLGCVKNLVDSEVMLGKLKDYEITQNPKEADVLIVNTCGFINSAKEESIETILELANEKKDELCKRLEEEKLVRISDSMLIKYLDMYASDESVELSPIQLKALDKLYKLGFERGVFSEPIKVEEYLIPKEYTAIRNS